MSSETVPVVAWFLSVLSHVDMSSSGHSPAAEPAEVGGTRRHAGGLPDRTGSQPGGLIIIQTKANKTGVIHCYSTDACFGQINLLLLLCYVCVLASGGEPQSKWR